MTNVALGIIVLGLAILLILLDLGSERSESVTPVIGEAWQASPIPTTFPDYELGYMDGYSDATNGESYGGDWK